MKLAQWVQWLRHTRDSAPSIEEQQQDVQRQIQLKHLVQLADERWAAKAPRVRDSDAPERPTRAALPKEPMASDGAAGSRTADDGDVSSQNGNGPKVGMETKTRDQGEKKKENPWKVQRGGRSEEWQPESWKPKY